MKLMFLFLKGELSDLKTVYSIVDFTSIFVLLLTIILFVIIGATKYQKNDPKLYKHFLACFFLKIFGCISFIVVYTFYYKYGDTFRYYENAKPILDMFSFSPATAIEVLGKGEIENGLLKDYPIFWENYDVEQGFDMQHDKTSYLVVRFIAFFGLFTFGSYLSVSFLFAALSTLGVWCLYRTFTHLFPGHENALAIPIIYFPSVFFWGSSIMKDSIVIGFLGFLTYAIYSIFVRKKHIFSSALLLLFSFYCLFTTKEYVIIAYVPAILIWIILSISNNLPKWFQVIFRPILAVFAVAAIFVVGPKVGEISEQYALESVLETAETTGQYIYRISTAQDGSAYSLGEISYTPQGLLSLFPKAVIVTLYRPFIFEVKNVLMLVSSIESSIVLFFTIFVLFRVGVFRFIRSLTEHPFLLAALTFSVFFAFAIGVSTFNFGSLARYKLPCLPFYGIAIIYPYSEYRMARKKRKLREQDLVIEDNYSPIPT